MDEIESKISFAIGRHMCLIYLLKCVDEEWQKCVLVAPRPNNLEYDYSEHYGEWLGDTINDMDGMFYSNEFDKNPSYDLVGKTFRSRKEAELANEVWQSHMDLYNTLYKVEIKSFFGLFSRPDVRHTKNHEYFESPIWRKLVDSAKLALEEFIKNDELTKLYHDKEYRLVRLKLMSDNFYVKIKKKVKEELEEGANSSEEKEKWGN